MIYQHKFPSLVPIMYKLSRELIPLDIRSRTIQSLLQMASSKPLPILQIKQQELSLSIDGKLFAIIRDTGHGIRVFTRRRVCELVDALAWGLPAKEVLDCAGFDSFEELAFAFGDLLAALYLDVTHRQPGFAG
jgi:hypothetical protein